MKTNVLVVVDDPIMGNLLEIRLVEAGYDARYLERPDDALKAIAAAVPSVPPVVVAAPETADGAFLASVKAAAGETTIPVILLPADDETIGPPESADDTVPVIPLPAPFDMAPLLEWLSEIAVETAAPDEPPQTEPEAPSAETDAEPAPPAGAEAEPEPSEDSEEAEMETAAEEAAAGDVTGIPGLLSSFHERGLTGLLEIRDLPEKAGVYLDAGEVVHAHYGDAQGKKALNRIIREPDGAPQFHSQPRLATETRSIREDFHRLMAEAGREADALRRVKRAVFDSILSVDEAALAAAPEIRDHGGLRHVLTLVDEHGRMRRVLDRSRMTDLQTYTNLVYLLKKGVVRARSDERVGVCVVTDSAADLPDGAAGDGLVAAPISVRLDGKIYRDGLDLGPERFYELLRRAKGFPETEPPSPEDFYPVFEAAAADADILGIFLSGKLSATAANARTAVDRYADAYRIRRRRTRSGGGRGSEPRIAVVDSQAVSLGLGLLAVAAAEKAREGASLDETQALVEGLIPALRTFFAVDSLAYLQRSGRLGRGKAIMGSMLGIRPILAVRHGEVIHVDQVRGEKMVPETLAEWIAWSLDDPRAPLRVGIMHASAPERAERLAETLETRFDCRQTTISQIGPVVGAHCGPGTVGAAVLPA